MRRPAWLSGRLGDPDATHSLRPPPRRRGRILPTVMVLSLMLLAGGLAAWLVFRSPPAPAKIALSLADEASLLAAPTDTFSLWRFSADPKIVVAIFPSLHAQATALNRVAAFIERPGVPHDHLLDDAPLAAAMGGTPENFDTYYYGHDYRESDLARFYATADRDRLVLTEPERILRTRLREAGFFALQAPSALISLPPHGPGLLDQPARSTVLHHELAHGAYFTDLAYAAYVEAFWTGLTEPQRAAFRSFLATEGYDTGNDDLMRNETQAYLVFTADARMFDPTRIGVPQALALRKSFIAGITLGWLREDAVGQ